jgi:hypothetical protein
MLQELCYLSEFPSLIITDVLEYTLSHHDIELLVTEPDRRFQEVGLNQIGRRIAYSDIHAMVLNIWIEQRRERARSATYV